MKKSMEKIFALCLALMLLLGSSLSSSLSVFAEEVGSVWYTVTFRDDANEIVEVVNDVLVHGAKDATVALDVDSIMPEGYELDSSVYTGFVPMVTLHFEHPEWCKTEVYVKKLTVDETPGAKGDFSFTVKFHDVDQDDKVIKNAIFVLNGKEGDYQTVDITSEIPAGYELDPSMTWQTVEVNAYVGFNSEKDVYVKKLPVEETPKTTLKVTFETVDGKYVGEETIVETAYNGSEGATWTFMLGTDFQLPEGYKLAAGVDQVTNIQIPFGATGGHTLVVEKIDNETPKTTLKVTFETVDGKYVGEETIVETAYNGSEGATWTFMLGTDFQLPEGYKLATGVDQVTNIQIPFGATGGHTLVVEKIANETPEKKDDNTNTTVTVVNTNNTVTPNTGDVTNVAVYVITMVICASAILAVGFKKFAVRR